MAIGDAGAAKGLLIYPSTQAHSLGYQNDNQRADDIAAEIDARAAADAAIVAAVRPITTGGTGATSAAAARTNLGITAANTPATILGNVQANLNYLHTTAGDHNAQLNAIFVAMAAHGWTV